MLARRLIGLSRLRNFGRKTLRLLRMAREALIYVSLAMYVEEATRHDEKEGVE